MADLKQSIYYLVNLGTANIKHFFNISDKKQIKSIK